MISLAAVGEPDDRGLRTVYFEINGQGRQVEVRDKRHAPPEETRRKADKGVPGHVGAPMPGTVIALHCSAGESVKEGDPLLTLEAMKMETIVRAPADGTVVELVPDVKAHVQAEDLIAVLS